MWKDLSSNAIALRFLKDDAKEALISSIRNSQNTISYQLHVPCILEEEEEEECEKGKTIIIIIINIVVLPYKIFLYIYVRVLMAMLLSK